VELFSDHPWLWDTSSHFKAPEPRDRKDCRIESAAAGGTDGDRVPDDAKNLFSYMHFGCCPRLVDVRDHAAGLVAAHQVVDTLKLAHGCCNGGSCLLLRAMSHGYFYNGSHDDL